MTPRRGRNNVRRTLRAPMLVALWAWVLAPCTIGLCPTGDLECGDQCVSGWSDPMNCGACGHACGPAGVEGASCEWGTCRCRGRLEFCELEAACVEASSYTVARCLGACRPEQTNCVTACADLSTHPAHCGRCGHACDAVSGCDGGACFCRQPGTERCGADCVDTRSDPRHCGGCGAACAGITSSCRDGLCMCPPGRSGVPSPCGGVCVDLAHDPANCGRCGAVCRPERVCSQGECVVSCGVGTVACDRSCRDLEGDPANCGGCGNVCAGACNHGHCVR